MISVDYEQVVYNGNGSQTAWPYSFPIYDGDVVRLILLDADGTETDITQDYYVDVPGSTVYYPGYAPGAEPPLEDQPPKVQTGQKLIVYRDTEITQDSDLGDSWPFNVIEKGLDKLTMILQEKAFALARCLKISKGQAAEIDDYDTTVPLAADKVVCGNANGTGFEAREAMMEVNGAWDGEGRQIHSVANPTLQQQAATKNYVDSIIAGIVATGNDVVVLDNVATLRTTDLQDGMYVNTAGYAEINDGGYGFYAIRAAQVGDVDDGGSIIILNNGNVAELVYCGSVTPEQFGAKGDGVTNDTVPMYNMMQYINSRKGGTVQYGTDKTYMLLWDYDTYGYLGSKFVGCDGLKLYGNGCTLRIMDGAKCGYNIGSEGSTIIIENCKNVVVENFNCYGNKVNAVYGTGDGDSFGIIVIDSQNVSVKNCVFRKFATDCGCSRHYNLNLVWENVIFDGGRRQGFSATGQEKEIFINCKFINTGDDDLVIAPGAGVDIEPLSGAYSKYVEFINCEIANNVGIQLTINNSHNNISDVLLENCYVGVDNYDTRAMQCNIDSLTCIGCTFHGNIFNASGTFKNCEVLYEYTGAVATYYAINAGGTSVLNFSDGKIKVVGNTDIIYFHTDDATKSQKLKTIRNTIMEIELDEDSTIPRWGHLYNITLENVVLINTGNATTKTVGYLGSECAFINCMSMSDRLVFNDIGSKTVSMCADRLVMPATVAKLQPDADNAISVKNTSLAQMANYGGQCNIETINDGVLFQRLVLYCGGASTMTIKHGTGNIRTKSQADVVIDRSYGTCIELVYVHNDTLGDYWMEL